MLVLVLIATALPVFCHGSGEVTEIDLTKDQWGQQAAQFALGEINSHYASQGDNDARTLVKIVHATKQVVAGLSYNLVLDVKSGNGEELCRVTVWSKPWMSGDEAMTVTAGPDCKKSADANVKRQILGGQSKIEMSDPEVQAAFAFGVDMLNAMENNMFYRKPLETNSIKVTKQVVSGFMYRFKDIPMANTKCLKNSLVKPELDSCMLSGDNSIRTCDIAVWYQSWMTPKYKLNEFNCQ